MLVVKIVLLLFLWHTAESNQGMSITCSTSHVEMLHPRKGIQLGNKPERKETKLVGVWKCGKQKKRQGKGKQKQPVLPQPMQTDAHEIVHEVVAGGHAAEDVPNQFALFLFAHLLVP